ncbi:hypothetical protein EVA_06956 [gut metagenome]|uniref:Uncharacterized protein n=1 Tax=gut metagenome TaxID=749906 RepID=J9GDH9_9ZZZZ
MGPYAVYHALRSSDPKIRVHFLSSVDGVLLERILDICDPLKTLVIVSLKASVLVRRLSMPQRLINGF